MPRINKLLCALVLLLAISIANASPTVTHHSTDMSVSLSITNTRITTSGSINTVVKPIRTELANLGKEFLQPPENSAGLLNVSNNSVKLLPAVPATALMLLTGFLCVSLYRDRRVWLMAMMGLLWAGQTGIQTIPRLAYHFSHKNHAKQQIRTELAYPYYLRIPHRLQCDIEGIRYIGLLHHLAGIPDSKSVSQLSYQTGQDSISTQTENTLRASLFAMMTPLSPSLYVTNCLAAVAEQQMCFSPAFIFETIPRGPPKLA